MTTALNIDKRCFSLSNAARAGVFGYACYATAVAIVAVVVIVVVLPSGAGVLVT